MIVSLKPVFNSKHVSFAEEIPDMNSLHTVNLLSSNSLYVLDTLTDYFSLLPSILLFHEDTHQVFTHSTFSLSLIGWPKVGGLIFASADLLFCITE